MNWRKRKKEIRRAMAPRYRYSKSANRAVADAANGSDKAILWNRRYGSARKFNESDSACRGGHMPGKGGACTVCGAK